jgi:8-oxo-dGTP pyrophosphatase MutT (NUDIX family)
MSWSIKLMSDPLVLQRVKEALEEKGSGVFCFICGGAEPQPIQTGEGQQFLCPAGHLSPRAFIFDGKARHTFDGERLIHETVGALVQRPAGGELLTLLFLRRKFPFQYTIPAGHLEEREPVAEMARELEEETGLTVNNAVLLWPDDLPLLFDPCRRGADWHRWRLFQVSAAGLPRLSDERRIIGWYRDREVQTLADQHLLTAPVQVLFERLHIIRPGSEV